MNYSQDTFVEYMVKRKLSKKDWLLFGASGLLGAVIILVGFIATLITRTPAIAFFALVGAVAAVWYICTRRNLEYEYAVTNGYVSVDKIINKSSRKRLTSFECADVEEYGSYAENAENLAKKRVDARILACSDDSGTGADYILTRSKKTGYTILVIDHSEEIEQAMKPYFPRQLRVELMQKERERR